MMPDAEGRAAAVRVTLALACPATLPDIYEADDRQLLILAPASCSAAAFTARSRGSSRDVPSASNGTCQVPNRRHSTHVLHHPSFLNRTSQFL
jgi:hypothetical protein